MELRRGEGRKGGRSLGIMVGVVLEDKLMLTREDGIFEIRGLGLGTKIRG